LAKTDGAGPRHVNPNNPTTEAITNDVQAAAQTLGLKTQVLHASNDRDIDAAFEALAQQAAENRILKAQLEGRLKLSDAERATLGEGSNAARIASTRFLASEACLPLSERERAALATLVRQM